MNRNNITICSYNMHGFNNGISCLKELCENNNTIFIQEHWVHPQHLVRFDNINEDFSFHGLFAMDTVCFVLIQLLAATVNKWCIM